MHQPSSRRPIRLALIALVAGLAIARGPAPAAADPSPVATFAARAYADQHDDTERCPVCGSAREARPAARLTFLGGRYVLDHVRQAHCAHCGVTTLEVADTGAARRLIARLRLFVPATRRSIVRHPHAYTVALSTPADRPFIREVRGLDRADGHIVLEVD